MAATDRVNVVRDELMLLLDRAVLARRDSAVLADMLSSCRASMQRILAEGQDNRLRWNAWRAGMAQLAARARVDEAMLRVCMLCDAVCFAQPVADAADTEQWVDPPETIRQRFRDGWDGPVRSHGICPRCLPAYETEIDAAVPHDAGLSSGLLAVFQRIDESAASIAAGDASVDAETALELAYREVVDYLAERLPEAELSALVTALQALVHHLGGTSLDPTRSPHRPTDGSARIRFRPPLRST